MFSSYLIIPVALLWTLNSVCIFSQVPCSQMSAIRQLRTHPGWVGRKHYSYILAKTFLFLHTIFTTVQHYWLMLSLWSTKFPHPFLLSSCCLASHSPCCIWVYDLLLTEDKPLHKTLQTHILRGFLEVVTVKNQSEFDSRLPGCLKPVSAWWHLQAECPHALTCHSSHSWNREQLWQIPVGSQPEWQSSQYTPPKSPVPVFFAHATTSANFASLEMARNKNKTPCLWKDSSSEDEERKTRTDKCTRSSQTSEKHMLEKQIPVKDNEAKKSPLSRQCCRDCEVRA